jgi:hypothetical protein
MVVAPVQTMGLPSASTQVPGTVRITDPESPAPEPPELEPDVPPPVEPPPRPPVTAEPLGALPAVTPAELLAPLELPKNDPTPGFAVVLLAAAFDELGDVAWLD